jgi:hypothetical protein
MTGMISVPIYCPPRTSLTQAKIVMLTQTTLPDERAQRRWGQGGRPGQTSVSSDQSS